MLAARVYHQSGFWGCFSTCDPVLVNAAHVGGWTWSMFSLRYLASLSMNCCAGTSCGVVKFAVSFWFFPCSKTGKPNIKAFTFQEGIVARFFSIAPLYKAGCMEYDRPSKGFCKESLTRSK